MASVKGGFIMSYLLQTAITKGGYVLRGICLYVCLPDNIRALEYLDILPIFLTYD